MKAASAVAFLLLALGAWGCAHALEPDDFRCFKSTDVQPPIRLELVLADGPDHDSYVVYEHGHGRIALKQFEEKEIAAAGDRPGEFRMRWHEAGADGGEYVMTSQGARVSDFRYVRKRDGKVFRFEEDLAASGQHGCDWQH